MKAIACPVAGAWVLAFLAGCAGARPVEGPGAVTAGSRPNVVLILADDLGYADLGAQGSVDLSTPNLDALARAGLQCTDAYVAAPQCFPSRAALLTGRYAQRFGIEHNMSASPANLPLDQPTLAERLRAAGYATGLVGKWNLGEDEAHHPIARGFDEFFGFLGFAHRYVRNDRFKPDEKDKLQRGREPVLESAYLTDAFARESREFILRHADHPFFLLASFNAPHMPLQADPVRRARFAALPDEARGTYAAMVESLDDAVGVIRATLEEAGLVEDTIVVFLSDNGGMSEEGGESRRAARNHPLHGGKHSLWEGGIRVPFLVAWEGTVPARGLEHRPVLSIDIAATVLEACGAVPGAGALDGPSRLGRWTGREDDPGTDPLYWRYMGGPNLAGVRAWAVREGPWKAVLPHWRYGVQGDDSNLRLHRLPEDPGEERNLAAEEPEVLSRLKGLWEAWNATLPSPSDGAAADAPGDAEFD